MNDMGRLLLVMLVIAKISAAEGIVADVKAAIAQKDFASAESKIRTRRAQAGLTPELIEAISWMGRGELAEKHYEKAQAWAEEARKLSMAQLKTRKLDAEPHLPLALGASIEVQAQVMNARGARAEGVSFLRQEVQRWHDTSIRARIQKNINLLTLEGKPAPFLQVSPWLIEKPMPLSAMKGHPVLLFFWAHWCSDCKAEVSAIAKLNATYGPRGLMVVGPTQHYGYVAGGEDAAPQRETKYIAEVHEKYYARVGRMPVPLNEENFRRYGASTTPTLVLIDRQGIVRMFNPGRMTYEDLSSRIERLL